MTAVTQRDREAVLSFCRAELARDDGTAMNAAIASQAIAQLDLAEALRSQVGRVGDRALRETIVRIARDESLPSAQEELDAIYEALRQHGHAV